MAGKAKTPEQRASISRGLMGHVISEETRAKISRSLTGYKHIGRKNLVPISEEARAKHSANGRAAFRGGRTGEAYAKVLCSAGYIQEHRVYHNGRRFVLDFAEPESKTCFELDGPYHYTSREEDAERDSVLRTLGWRVIRINHIWEY